MSLTSRFFKKPWQNKHADTRRTAVETLHDDELITALPELAEHDPEADIRLAALKRLNTEPFWLDARLRESDPAILKAADRFLLRAAIDQSAPKLRAERQQWLKRLESTETIKTLALKSCDIELRESAQERIQSPGFLGDCYASEDNPGLAEKMLARIGQISTLERLHQKLKQTSKKKAKAVQQRIHDLQSATGDFDAETASAQQLVERAESLARGENMERRSERLEEIKSEWSLLKEPNDALLKRLEGAIRIVESAINRPERTHADPSATTREAGEVVADAESLMQQVADEIRSQLRSRSKDMTPQKLLASWDRAWNDLGKASESDQAVKNEMLPILNELQIQVQQSSSKDSGSRASGDSSGHEDVARAPALTTIDFDAELDELAKTLESGEIVQAHTKLRDFKAGLMALPPRSRPKSALGRMQRLEGRLKEMRDYQHWSNNKHRDELIERVEALPDSGQHPDAISAALKETRAEWQRLEKLEVLPGDRRQHAAPPGQWRRFQEACSAAFDTAKPYFEKRQSIQDETLRALESFIAQGQALAADEDADPKTLMPTQRKARAAIRRLDELPPRTRGAAAGKLRGLMDAISKRLDQAFEHVELAKQRLITEAEKLGDEADLKAAIDRAKGLQAEWKRSGQGRRKRDQQQWTQFRAAIDPLFEKLDGERKQRDQANQESIAELKSICDQAEALASSGADSLDQAENQMRALVKDWEQHSRRPVDLSKRFENARIKLEDHRQSAQKAARQQAALGVSQMAEAVQKGFLQRLQGKTLAVEDIKGKLAEPPDELLKSAEQVSDPALSEDKLHEMAKSNLESALQIAVEFEFLSGLESPPEEKARRMDYQVHRLAQRMTERSGQQDLATDLSELEARWYRALPLPEAAYESLRARVEKSQQLLNQMLGNS